LIISHALKAAPITEGDGAPTKFSDADLIHFRLNELDPSWAGGAVFSDRRERFSTLSPTDIFAELSTIGGDRGWYSGQFLWAVRGLIDQLIGGPGLRRGRRAKLRVGDALDFWRIEKLESPTTLRLRAEMRLPGLAWLTWTITPTEEGSKVVQEAEFRPKGFLGRLYWYFVLPFHQLIFPGMLTRMLAAAEARP
jgi:hypothetical protein